VVGQLGEQGRGHVGEAGAAQLAQAILVIIGNGLQGGKLLFGGVRKDIAGDFGRNEGEGFAGSLLVGLAAGGRTSFSRALGGGAQGLHVGNDFVEALGHGLQRPVVGVGGGVGFEGGGEGFGGGEAVVLFGS